MKKRIKLFMVAGLFLVTALEAAKTDLGNGFWLEENGVTVTCVDANANDVSTTQHNSKLFTKYATASNAKTNAATACTSGITDMHHLFNESVPNGDISHWDVSSVTDMSMMFQNSSFNGNISDWNVSSVTSMNYMFANNNGNSAFNQDISKWDVSSVKFMNFMFYGVSQFNQDLSGWCMSGVTTPPSSFDAGASAWIKPNSRPIWGTCLAKNELGNGFFVHENGVTVTCTGVANGNVSLKPLNGKIFTKRDKADIIEANADATCTTGITDMSGLFSGQGSFDANISHWDTSSVTQMYNMFKNATAFNQDISKWDTSKVTLMQSVFEYATAFNQDIGSWDVSKVTSMNDMFAFATAFNQDLSDWCVSGIATLPASFDHDTSAWTNASHKPQWGAPCKTSLGNKFFLDPNGVTVTCNKAGLGDASTILHGGKLFTKRTAAQIKADNTLADKACTTGITGEDMIGMFQNKYTFDANISHWDTSDVTDMTNLFKQAKAFNQDLSKWDTSNVIYMESMFEEAEAFNQDISDWNTSTVTTMQSMFSNAKAFNQDLNDWNTSKVETMQAMFNYATVFNGNINNWDTSSVTTMYAMFANAKNFNQSLNGWDTSKVEYMQEMFNLATNFNASIADWNTSSVTTMSQMFEEATNFNQSLNSWDTSKVSNMGQMFNKATNFNANIADWNTSSVTNMGNMFRNTTAFNQNIAEWNTSSVTNMGYMFRDATAFNQNLSGWCVATLSEPSNFATGATLWTDPSYKPVWNTACNPILISPMIAKGSVYKSTKATYTVKTGNTLAYILNDANTTTLPTSGDALPTGTTSYASGANILNATVEKYLVIYEVNSASKIVGFFQKVLLTTDINSDQPAPPPPPPPAPDPVKPDPVEPDPEPTPDPVEPDNPIVCDGAIAYINGIAYCKDDEKIVVVEDEEGTTVSQKTTDKEGQEVIAKANEKDGVVSHTVEKGGKVTKATSQVPNSKTNIKTDGSVETTATLNSNGAKIKAVASSDGSASHEVDINGKKSVVNSSIVGATTDITQEGDVKTSVAPQTFVDKNGCDIQAVVSTTATGLTSSGYVRTCNSVATPQLTTNKETPFEPGNTSRIYEENAVIKIEVTADVTKPIIF